MLFFSAFCSVAKSLGGSNTDPLNLMPQWQMSNREGRWKDFEYGLTLLVKISACKNSPISISLEYDGSGNTPTGGKYAIELSSACKTAALSSTVQSVKNLVDLGADTSFVKQLLVSNNYLYRTKWVNGMADLTDPNTNNLAQWDPTVTHPTFHTMKRSDPSILPINEITVIFKCVLSLTEFTQQMTISETTKGSSILNPQFDQIDTLLPETWINEDFGSLFFDTCMTVQVEGSMVPNKVCYLPPGWQLYVEIDAPKLYVSIPVPFDSNGQPTPIPRVTVLFPDLSISPASNSFPLFGPYPSGSIYWR